MTATADATALFTGLLRRFGAGDVARRLGTTTRSVQRWAKGDRHPSAEVVEHARALAGELPTADVALRMDEDASEGVGVPSPTQADPKRAGVSIPREDAAVTSLDEDDADEDGPLPAPDVARENVERLRREALRLEADPSATATERAKVAGQLTSAARLYARTSGSLELTPQTVLRSRVWRELQVVVVDSLRGHPEAMAVVAKALREFEAKGGTR
jgi:hypothetical protein